MHYYKRHIGDYLRDTAHLSLLEHGIYSRLMDVYYIQETGITAQHATRLIGARSEDERMATAAVLAEFFTLEGDVWRHKRCDAEIAKASAKAEHNRKVGLRGGRPASAEEPRNNPDGFQTEPKPNPEITQMVPENNPTPLLHYSTTPLPITQERVMGKDLEAPVPVAAQKRGTRLPADWALPDDWRTWAISARPDIDAALEAEKFCDYWHAKSGRDATKADWLATWRNWIRNAKGATRPALSAISERAVL